eukprot:SAG31_NODE_3328_length_4401_cov_4.831939_3_plen_224_part_00
MSSSRSQAPRPNPAIPPLAPQSPFRPGAPDHQRRRRVHTLRAMARNIVNSRRRRPTWIGAGVVVILALVAPFSLVVAVTADESTSVEIGGYICLLLPGGSRARGVPPSDTGYDSSLCMLQADVLSMANLTGGAAAGGSLGSPHSLKCLTKIMFPLCPQAAHNLAELRQTVQVVCLNVQRKSADMWQAAKRTHLKFRSKPAYVRHAAATSSTSGVRQVCTTALL